jgi:predicted O-methyltransferase YrrM
LNIQNFEEFLSSLNVKIPSIGQFIDLADMTTLFYDQSKNRFIRLNYERGLLLYALISKFKPKNILEIGTASGYGTLSMAWAMSDNNIDGKIFTIDPIPISEKTERPLYDHSNKGQRIENVSVQEIWKKVAKQDWLDRVVTLCGYSGEIMRKNNLPKFDFAYIDGAHFFEAVKHDFYSVINNAAGEFGILFDDYVDRPQYGIKKLIDEEISKIFDVTLIRTDTDNNLAEMLSLTDPIYGMCWIHSSSLKKPLAEIYPKNQTDKFIDKYLRFEKRLKMRYEINKKLPFIKNTRFRFWK